MFSHGIMTALFFAVVGMVYDRAHTRDIRELGGLYKVMPIAAIGFIVGGLVSMGMPGFSGFIAEMPIYIGAWKSVPLVAIISSISIVVTAAYILLVARRVFFGDVPEGIKSGLSDITSMDKAVVILLSVILLVVGVFPSVLVPWIEAGVRHILVLTGGG